MSTLIDYTRGFHILSKKLNLSAGTRSLFAALVGEFNAAYFPERLSLSDRDLQKIAGLKSVSSVHECKNVLKNHKLIDFTARHGRNGYSEYILLSSWIVSGENQPNIYRTNTEQSANINRTIGAVSHYPAHEDVKTSDIRQDNDDGARAFQEFDAVLDYWEDTLKGGRLTVEHQSQIQRWVQDFGADYVKSRMKQAADSNNNPRGISFNYLKSHMKGVKEYDKPEGNTDWQRYVEAAVRM